MKTSAASCLIALSIFASISTAIPLFRPAKNVIARQPQPQSYSVVAVDGGSSTVAPATKTVTDAVTLFSTATVMPTGPTDAPATMIVTYAMTVTAQPSVTSVPYDDGQWHTTYYFRSTMAPAPDVNAAAVTPSASTPPMQPTPSPAPAPVDPGQWGPWSDRNTGAYVPS